MTTHTEKSRVHVRSIFPDRTIVGLETVPDKTGGCLDQESADRPARVVIRAAGESKKEFFLTVFHAGSGTSAMPSVEALSPPAADMKGVLIKDATQNRGLLVSESGQPVTSAISFAIHPGTGMEFLVADLPPGRTYAVTVKRGPGEQTVTLEPSTSGWVTADAQGVLRLTL